MALHSFEGKEWYKTNFAWFSPVDDCESVEVYQGGVKTRSNQFIFTAKELQHVLQHQHILNLSDAKNVQLLAKAGAWTTHDLQRLLLQKYHVWPRNVKIRVIVPRQSADPSKLISFQSTVRIMDATTVIQNFQRMPMMFLKAASCMAHDGIQLAQSLQSKFGYDGWSYSSLEAWHFVPNESETDYAFTLSWAAGEYLLNIEKPGMSRFRKWLVARGVQK